RRPERSRRGCRGTRPAIRRPTKACRMSSCVVPPRRSAKSASPPREARTSATVQKTMPLVLASRGGLAGLAHSTTDLIADQFAEQFRPSRPQHVVRQRSLSCQQRRVERRHDHFFPNALLLRTRNQFTVWPPDQSGASVVRLILTVARPQRDVSRAAD